MQACFKKLDRKQIIKLSKVKYEYMFYKTKYQKNLIDIIIPVLDMRNSILKEQET